MTTPNRCFQNICTIFLSRCLSPPLSLSFTRLIFPFLEPLLTMIKTSFIYSVTRCQLICSGHFGMNHAIAVGGFWPIDVIIALNYIGGCLFSLSLTVPQYVQLHVIGNMTTIDFHNYRFGIPCFIFHLHNSRSFEPPKIDYLTNQCYHRIFGCGVRCMNRTVTATHCCRCSAFIFLQLDSSEIVCHIFV